MWLARTPIEISNSGAQTKSKKTATIMTWYNYKREETSLSANPRLFLFAWIPVLRRLSQPKVNFFERSYSLS
jgi:hypothetical protein